MTIRIESLWIHPIKSCAAVRVERIELDDLGAVGDRRWMVVAAGSGAMVTQRTHPVMAMVAPVVRPDGLRLRDRNGRRHDLDVAFPGPGAATIDSVVWHDRVRGRDGGDQAAAWMSDALQAPVRLIHFDATAPRPLDPTFSPPDRHTGFADGFPLLVLSAAAVGSLNNHLAAPVDARRFRANVVLSGCGAHAEDGWQRIVVNDVVLDLVKPCERCSVPGVDPDSGTPDKVTVKAMATIRRGEDGAVYYGMNAIHGGPGWLQSGAAVTVVQ